MKKGFIEIDENDIRAIERLRDFTLELSEEGYGIFSTKWINQSIDLTNRMHSALKGNVIKCINENYAKGIPKCKSWCGEDYCKQTKEAKKMKHIKKIATQIGGIIISRLNRNESKVFLQDGSGEGMEISKTKMDKALGFDVFELDVKDITPNHVAAVHKFYQEEF